MFIFSKRNNGRKNLKIIDLCRGGKNQEKAGKDRPHWTYLILYFGAMHMFYVIIKPFLVKINLKILNEMSNEYLKSLKS